jgi:kynurenine 3-monooxygenase
MKVTIIGAGLAGSLLAIRLAQRGYQISVYEKRPDLRSQKISAGRSINLALSSRGINALRMVDLESEMLQLAIPMHARMVHTVGKPALTTPYSGRSGEYINSISRGALNKALLHKAASFENVHLYFHAECVDVDLEQNKAYFLQHHDKLTSTADIIIGTDGAGSALRNSFEKNCPNFSLSQQFLEHGYKELNIPPAIDGSFQLEKNVLHIWPRGSYMCIALPNPDGDFTVTLFLANKDATPSFDHLKSEEEVQTFFHQIFPEIAQSIPNLSEQFFRNPVGGLGTIKCGPYHYKNKSLLLGDAAHAIVPFYGQGMNCSFEDVVVLDELIDKYQNNWEIILEKYTMLRKPNCDAIADLAVDNFYEMRDATANPIFQKKRLLETTLEQKYSDYYSKYSLVTFRPDVSYEQAMIKGRKQDAYLMSICANDVAMDEQILHEAYRYCKSI